MHSLLKTTPPTTTASYHSSALGTTSLTHLICSFPFLRAFVCVFLSHSIGFFGCIGCVFGCSHWRKIGFRLLAVIPPMVGAAFKHNLETILDYAGEENSVLGLRLSVSVSVSLFVSLSVSLSFFLSVSLSLSRVFSCLSALLSRCAFFCVSYMRASVRIAVSLSLSLCFSVSLPL